MPPDERPYKSSKTSSCLSVKTSYMASLISAILTSPCTGYKESKRSPRKPVLLQLQILRFSSGYKMGKKEILSAKHWLKLRFWIQSKTANFLNFFQNMLYLITFWRISYTDIILTSFLSPSLF